LISPQKPDAEGLTILKYLQVDRATFPLVCNPTRRAAPRERWPDGRWRHISRQSVSFSWPFVAFPKRLKRTIRSVLSGDFTLTMLLTFRHWPRWVIYSSLCAQCSLRCAETFSVREKNGGDQMFEIIQAKRRILEDLYWVIKTLCAQNEANAFSFWECDSSYQVILEFGILYNHQWELYHWRTCYAINKSFRTSSLHL
jgi:hypothetical protein